MNVRDLSRIDSLLLKFRAPGNPIGKGDEGLDGFLDALEAHAGELMPTSVKGKRMRKYSRESFGKALIERKDSRYSCISVYFERPPSPEVDASLDILGSPDEWVFRIWALPLTYFQDPARAEERSRKLVDLVRALASHYPALYATVHSDADYELAMDVDPNSEVKPTYEQVHQVYWLNVLGRKLVESIGRERVLSTPAHFLEELSGGDVLLVTRPTVADVTSEESRLAQARALVHLRPDLSFDKVLANLRERSAALAPVEPRFDPDVAELMKELVDDVSLGKRQRRIAELNAYRPPEVTQWQPREAALAPDLPDPAKALDRYNVYSENLGLLLEVWVPNALDESPQVLPSLDFNIWRFNYPEERDRAFVERELTIWVGAYLGQVMVHYLKGRWVPRKNLLESHVLLGDRAFLPFLRAQYYLETRQSVLDYSMTQFFHFAERYLRQLSQG